MINRPLGSGVLTVDDEEVGIPWWRQHHQQNRDHVLGEKSRKRCIERFVARKERRVRENTLTPQFLNNWCLREASDSHPNQRTHTSALGEQN